MDLNATPSANRIHIGFFGRVNAGKSSLVNALTGQELAVVSEIKGTTTDPVYKAMELNPLGPVMLIDTPGVDDCGPLGERRIQKSLQVLNKVHLAVIVIDSVTGRTEKDEKLIALCAEKNIKFLVVYNKSDLRPSLEARENPAQENEIFVSSKTGYNIEKLKAKIVALAGRAEKKASLVGDLIEPGDVVVLVTPLDEAAPKGRLILPQQQTIRDILENGAVAVVGQEFSLEEILGNLKKAPKLVITDSRIFAQVAAITPAAVPLTSFSILFARYKGNLEEAVKGIRTLETLTGGDSILISEGCTHHRQCEDIGTVKLPQWIKKHTGKDFRYSFTSGQEFPAVLSAYKLIIHCGGCMLNDREMKYRQQCAREQGVPITNYGLLIAHLQGVLKRSLSIFPHYRSLLPVKED
ncbi:MAG: [FeFe] hydrogenase H-cluster maturation GTPase HydF [Desulfitobacteriia bacterium]|jgi:[FeFe] hydrogenase H-cluster maturation GTPase HydF